MTSNYLSDIKLKDFSMSLQTEEFSVWNKECQHLFDYIINKFNDTKGVSKGTICKNIKDSISKLGLSFKQITGKKLCITKKGSLDIQKYLKGVYGRSIIYSQYKFDDEVFKTLLKLEYSAIISVNESVYAGQLVLIAFKLLFQYFKIYDKDALNNCYWTVTFHQINNIIDSILDETVSELLNDKEVKKIKKELQLEDSIKAAYRNKMIFEPEVKYLGVKPFNAQCLRDLWKGIPDDEITQPEKLEMIMERYNCSLSTATRYMKKFGLWISRAEKKSEMTEVERLRLENLELKKRIKELEESVQETKQEPEPESSVDSSIDDLNVTFTEGPYTPEPDKKSEWDNLDIDIDKITSNIYTTG